MYEQEMKFSGFKIKQNLNHDKKYG
jgi:hypothetical protein